MKTKIVKITYPDKKTPDVKREISVNFEIDDLAQTATTTWSIDGLEDVVYILKQYVTVEVIDKND